MSSVYRLIQDTIEVSYRGVYRQEAVEFFKNYHSEEQILNDAATGYTIVAEYHDELVGTGTLCGINIRRVFVSPSNQHRGTGRLIVRELERTASLNKSTNIDLEASLVSRRFWESMGFVVQSYNTFPVSNNQRLDYYRMSKTLDDS